MAAAQHLAIEVRYVPLSESELAERRARLRVLLLRGALRVIQQLADVPAPITATPAELTRK